MHGQDVNVLEASNQKAQSMATPVNITKGQDLAKANAFAQTRDREARERVQRAKQALVRGIMGGAGPGEVRGFGISQSSTGVGRGAGIGMRGGAPDPGGGTGGAGLG